MSYSYPQAVLIICDSLATTNLAKHLFSAQFNNAVINDAAARAYRVHETASAGLTPSRAVGSLTIQKLMESHRHIINVSQDPNYYIKDIENTMLGSKPGKNLPQGKMFNVILMTEPLFSAEQIKRVKCRKIYFYENRDDKFDPPLKSVYCAKDDDEFEVIGFQGSTVNLSQHIKTIYSRYGFQV